MDNKNIKIGPLTLKAILEASKEADKIFMQLSNVDLSELNNSEMTQFAYGVGIRLGELNSVKEFINEPDYNQTIARYETLREKVFKEAKRRDLNI